MKTLVIYDTNFGNTQKIAEAIAQGLREKGKAVSVLDLQKSDFDGVTNLIVGSPIYQWQPTQNMLNWLATLKPGQLFGIKATTFDTRVKLFIHGDARNKIASLLEKAGATITGSPGAFFVKGKEGPLFDGEIEKAKKWGEQG